MAATAEIAKAGQLGMQEPPAAFLFSEMPAERMTRESAGRFISQVAVGNEVELKTSKINSLKEALQLAAEGDPAALAMVETNVSTDFAERALKAGFIRKQGLELEVDEDNNIYQHGQTLESVQANSLLYASNHPAMRCRSEAETRNSFRLKEALSQGLLEDHYFLVASMAADDMCKEDMEQANFFTETMSMALQFATVKNGQLVIVPAFVAGKVDEGASRHDHEALALVAQRLGFDWSGKSATEIIDSPVLINKSLMPNGEVDFIELLDTCASEIVGKQLFFGQNKPVEDYLAYQDKCYEKELGFKDKIQLITQELIKQAPYLTSEVDACRRLNKISGKHLVDKAIEDPTIDARVFGVEAAGYVMEARYQQQIGNHHQVMVMRQLARRTERSGSCPSSTDKSETLDKLGIDVYGFRPEGESKGPWHGGKIRKNSKCRSCEKVKSEVGACHICKDCVDNPKLRERKYKEFKTRTSRTLQSNFIFASRRQGSKQEV
jgi:hypothetical protein